MSIQRRLSCTPVLILIVAASLACTGNLSGDDGSTDAPTDGRASTTLTVPLIRWTQGQMPPRTALRTRMYHLPTRWCRRRTAGLACGNGQIDPGENLRRRAF